MQISIFLRRHRIPVLKAIFRPESSVHGPDPGQAEQLRQGKRPLPVIGRGQPHPPPLPAAQTPRRQGQGAVLRPGGPPWGVPRGAGLRPSPPDDPSGPVIRRENRRRRRPPSSSPRASRCPSPWTQARHRPGSGGWQITSNRWSSPAAVTVMVPAARSPIYTGYVMQRASPSKHPRQGLCQCMHSLRRGCPVPPYPAEGRLSTTRSHPRLSVS